MGDERVTFCGWRSRLVSTDQAWLTSQLNAEYLAGMHGAAAYHYLFVTPSAWYRTPPVGRWSWDDGGEWTSDAWLTGQDRTFTGVLPCDSSRLRSS